MIHSANFWADARNRIRAIAQWDTGATQSERNSEFVFGSGCHRYEIFNTVSESELEVFESQHKIVIPPDYRAFLLHFGAGGPGPDYGIYDFTKITPCNVDTPLHLTESQFWPDDDDDPIYDLPGLLEISTSGCGIDWYIEVNGPQPGTMWVNAGPGEQLMMQAVFGEWYSKWLERVEFGMENHKIMTEMVASGATAEQIKAAMPAKAHEWERDHTRFLKFFGIPGKLEIVDDAVVAHHMSCDWIQ